MTLPNWFCRSNIICVPSPLYICDARFKATKRIASPRVPHTYCCSSPTNLRGILCSCETLQKLVPWTLSKAIMAAAKNQSLSTNLGCTYPPVQSVLLQCATTPSNRANHLLHAAPCNFARTCYCVVHTCPAMFGVKANIGQMFRMDTFISPCKDSLSLFPDTLGKNDAASHHLYLSSLKC